MCATVIPARFPLSDSHETENAMRIYKQSLLSTHLSIFLQRDLCGRLSVPQNPYGRRLVHVLLENSEGLKENLTEKLASQGFTLSHYTTGIDLAIDIVMRKAIDEKRGIFTLLDEAFTYSFRPWDVLKLMKTGHTGAYGEYREILNTPMDPNLAWTRLLLGKQVFCCAKYHTRRWPWPICPTTQGQYSCRTCVYLCLAKYNN
jgi:hypothetical protein